ncbi:MAG: hypothetical protein JXR46_16305 [Calditrichaceae bacterium]|nr:hypothetical protein [Calditrichaceae bacterium]MBN2710608.1 hypothetical protein [Calditrichaceae bacterium]RQV96788.1 MAG: hypothetical protein EH224_03430 [Calditrichota bacterium]
MPYKTSFIVFFFIVIIISGCFRQSYSVINSSPSKDTYLAILDSISNENEAEILLNNEVRLYAEIERLDKDSVYIDKAEKIIKRKKYDFNKSKTQSDYDIKHVYSYNEINYIKFNYITNSALTGFAAGAGIGFIYMYYNSSESSVSFVQTFSGIIGGVAGGLIGALIGAGIGEYDQFIFIDE